MNIPSYIILWLELFLENSTQAVRVRSSGTVGVSSGVPQGSVLVQSYSPFILKIF